MLEAEAAMATAAPYLSRDELRALRRRSDWRGAWMVAHAWGLIAGAMALFAAWPNPLSFVLAVMVVGARQLGLGVLMHDAAHGLLFRDRRLNDRVGNWLCAYPQLLDLDVYRPYHFEHHKRTQQPDDPDLPLSAKFPVSRASFLRKSLRDLTGITFLRQYRAAMDSPSRPGTAGPRRSLRGPLLANLALLAALAALGKPHYYAMFWLLPLATWRMWVTRLRNIAEHAVVRDDDDPLLNARTTLASPLERLFVAPYFVNYHVEHHLYMWIPCYNLPRAHRLFRDKGLTPRMEVRRGYAEVLGLAVRPA
jgi:fatty acid desaturase